MTFNNGKEMLDYINRGFDLYNPEKELYVFDYNTAGSICYYHVDNDTANKLRKEAKENDLYWEDFLSIVGQIADDPSYECYEDGDYSNLDWCNDNYDGEWEVVYGMA